MIKKILALLCLNLFLSGFIFGEDNTDDKTKNLSNTKKAIEFSIGGGSSLVCVTNGVYGNNDYSLLYFDSGSAGISIPASFLFYPCKYFGFGLKYSIGFSMNASSLFRTPSFSIQNKIDISNKLGSLKRKMWFLFEYGVSINYTFPSDYFFTKNSFQVSFYKPYLNIGPDIFAGYEFINGNFSFSAGFIYTGLYKFITIYYTILSESGRHYISQEWFHYFGLEFRWRFAYIKLLK